MLLGGICGNGGHGCNGQCGTGEGWGDGHSPLGIDDPDPDFGK
jgi:hypothetical protein